jgi:hypothetical protein
MQQPSNSGFSPSEASVADTHHDVLSNQPQPVEQGLLEHLQSGLPNPLDVLLAGDASAAGAVMNDVVLQPESSGLEVEGEQPACIQLGAESRLSQCKLWDIMSDYYASHGINAWLFNVPNFITSSTYMAEAYAEMVLAFLEDYWAHIDRNEPLYIVEMATGAGRFSYLLLQELARKLACFSRFQGLKIRYIMTDFTESNPEFWMKHDRLQPFVESGMLDFAVFNPLVADSMELLHSGERLSHDTIQNPVIAIANYFFDSIPQDVFRVESKVLKEGLVTLERTMDGVSPDAKPHIQEITTHFRYQELYNTNYYPDARMNAILNHYRHTLKNGTILFPVGAFDVVRNLQAMSNNRLVLLSSDKAYTSALEMIRCYKHDFAIHDGAFSYMVNYDAIGQYFMNGGGRVLHTEGKSLSIHTVCCIEMDAPDCPFERLQYLFREKFNRGNPMNSLCATMPGKESGNEVAQMSYLLGELRLHLADPHVVSTMAQQLVNILPHSLMNQQEDLLALMDDALANFYYYPGESNLPFWLSQLYFILNKYAESLACLNMTSRYFGEHEALLYLKAQSYERLEQWQDARMHYEQALAMNPEFPEAQEALDNLKTRLK